MSHDNYFPGDAYDNEITKAAFELTAYTVCGILFTKLGPRKLFFFAYLLAAVGGIGVLIVDEN